MDQLGQGHKEIAQHQKYLNRFRCVVSFSQSQILFLTITTLLSLDSKQK